MLRATTKTQRSQINKYIRTHTRTAEAHPADPRAESKRDPQGRQKCYQATIGVATAGKMRDSRMGQPPSAVARLNKLKSPCFYLWKWTRSYGFLKLLLTYLYLWLYYMACRILVPQPGTEPGSPAVKAWVLITGSPVNSLNLLFY